MRSEVRHCCSRVSKVGDRWAYATLAGNPCDSNKAKDQIASVKKARLNQGEALARVMDIIRLRAEKLGRALDFDTTTHNAVAPFVLASASATFCL